MDLFNNKKLKRSAEDLSECRKEKGKILRDKEELLKKYSSIIDIESKIENLKKKLDDIELKRGKLVSEYHEGKKIYNELLEETKIYESRLDLVSYGIYEPIFNFEDSEIYKRELLLIKTIVKDYITSGRAILAPTDWYLNDSIVKGRAMVKKNTKLILRSFNNECDTLLSKVKWNNVVAIETRILKSFNAINKLGVSFSISITKDYLDIKLRELKLTHEYNLKKYQEKEEQREIKARLREEEKAQRDFEIARKKAEQEENLYQKALEKAKRDLGLVNGEELVKLQSQIAELEENLKIAHEQKIRALSMAQQTKSGYVYVISNIGSFGEDVYKIGLTRRLEPLDRVKELGDSSVPFTFDVHALIYSDDAPALEYELHQIFKQKSVNLVNFRKEFFNVKLDDVEEAIKKITQSETEFSRVSEARQYKESLAIRLKQEEAEIVTEARFPDSLFDS